MKYATALHALLALMVLVACLGWQRPGGTVLLVPLWGAGVGATLGHMEHVRLLGPGRPGGSVMLQTAAPLPVAALLRQGIVPVSVPTALCGAAQGTKET